MLGHEFGIGEPCCRYVGDIPYLPIADGSNLYLATVIDLGSRRLACWAMADHTRTKLVENALVAAWCKRDSLRGTAFHSDHESVYTSKSYAALCTDLGVTQSMGAIGSSADNALAESFNTALKRELLHGQSAHPDQATTHRAVFRWTTRHNAQRRHSAIGNISPNANEPRVSTTLAEAA